MNLYQNKDKLFKKYHIVMKDNTINGSKFLDHNYYYFPIKNLNFWKIKNKSHSVNKTNDNKHSDTILNNTEKSSRINSGKKIKKKKWSVIQLLKINDKNITLHTQTNKRIVLFNSNKQMINQRSASSSNIHQDTYLPIIPKGISNQQIVEALGLPQLKYVKNDKGINIRVSDITNKVPDITNEIKEKKQKLIKNIIQYCYMNKTRYMMK